MTTVEMFRTYTPHSGGDNPALNEKVCVYLRYDVYPMHVFDSSDVDWAWADQRDDNDVCGWRLATVAEIEAGHRIDP